MSARSRAPEPVSEARKRNARGEGERLRAALMEAAAELMLEHGNAERLSIRSITARAGVSPTALYLHFADKQELLRAVSGEAFEELAGFMGDAAAAHDGEPRAQLHAIGEAYIRFAQQRPGHYRILFATPGRSPATEPAGPADEDAGTRALELLVRATAACVSDERDAWPVAIQLWTGLHGFLSLRSVLPGRDWPSSEDFLDGLFEAHIGPLP